MTTKRIDYYFSLIYILNKPNHFSNYFKLAELCKIKVSEYIQKISLNQSSNSVTRSTADHRSPFVVSFTSFTFREQRAFIFHDLYLPYLTNQELIFIHLKSVIGSFFCRFRSYICSLTSLYSYLAIYTLTSPFFVIILKKFAQRKTLIKLSSKNFFPILSSFICFKFF